MPAVMKAVTCLAALACFAPLTISAQAQPKKSERAMKRSEGMAPKKSERAMPAQGAAAGTPPASDERAMSPQDKK